MLMLAALQPAHAFEVIENVSLDGLAASALQCQLVSEPDTDACRLPAVFRPGLVWTPTTAGAVHVKLGFAAGNGLNPVSPFVLQPWAADLEDGLKDINGRGWSHLLTAYYEHRVALGNDTNVRVAGGIIDATDFLDVNAFANSEYGQFLNSAFVNTQLGPRNTLSPKVTPWYRLTLF